MGKQRIIRINITDEDGNLLETFPVAHWRTRPMPADAEGVCSCSSNALLLERIINHVGSPEELKCAA